MLRAFWEEKDLFSVPFPLVAREFEMGERSHDTDSKSGKEPNTS